MEKEVRQNHSSRGSKAWSNLQDPSDSNTTGHRTLPESFASGGDTLRLKKKVKKIHKIWMTSENFE